MIRARFRELVEAEVTGRDGERTRTLAIDVAGSDLTTAQRVITGEKESGTEITLFSDQHEDSIGSASASAGTTWSIETSVLNNAIHQVLQSVHKAIQ